MQIIILKINYEELQEEIHRDVAKMIFYFKLMNISVDEIYTKGYTKIFSPSLYKTLKTKGLNALEKLMDMILLIMAVQMFIDGIRGLLPTL